MTGSVNLWPFMCDQSGMRTPLRFFIAAVVIAGLAVDAYMHFKMAPGLDSKKGTGVSAGMLFRAQGAAAVVAALLVLIRANRATFALAFLVASGAVGALLLYHFVDVGPIGPMPNMYTPIWYTDKVITLVAEVLAVLAALIGALWRPAAGGPPR